MAIVTALAAGLCATVSTTVAAATYTLTNLNDSGGRCVRPPDKTTVKRGSTIPVKFRVLHTNGNPILAALTATFVCPSATGPAATVIFNNCHPPRLPCACTMRGFGRTSRVVGTDQTNGGPSTQVTRECLTPEVTGRTACKM